MCQRDRASEHRGIAIPVGNHRADTHTSKQKCRRVTCGERLSAGNTKGWIGQARQWPTTEIADHCTGRAPNTRSGQRNEASEHKSSRAPEITAPVSNHRDDKQHTKQTSKQASKRVSRKRRALDKSCAKMAERRQAPKRQGIGCRARSNVDRGCCGRSLERKGKNTKGP